MLLILVGVALLLAACEFRIHVDLAIEEDESGTMSVELSMDKELVTLLGGDFGEMLAITDDSVPPGWTTEAVSEGGYDGVRASTDFGSFYELDQRLSQLVEDTGLSDTPLPSLITGIAPTREEDRFIFRVVIPGQAEDLLGDSLEESPVPLDLEMLDEVFDFRISLTLPGDILANNADLVTGQTLIWNISLVDSGPILEAESQLSGPDQSRLIMLVAVGLALVVVGYIVVKLRKHRQDPSPVEPEAS